MDSSGTFLSPRSRSPQKIGLPTIGSSCLDGDNGGGGGSGGGIGVGSGPLGGSESVSTAPVGPAVPAAPLIEEETRSSFTDQPLSKPASPVGEPPLEETGTPSQSMDGTEDSKSAKAAKKKLRCSDLQIAEQALGLPDRQSLHVLHEIDDNTYTQFPT